MNLEQNYSNQMTAKGLLYAYAEAVKLNGDANVSSLYQTCSL